MNNKTIKSVLVTLFVLLSVLMYSQTDYSFRSIGTEQGLSDNYVEQVYEDSRGFIWIATHRGLNRYDGHSFKAYNMPRNNAIKSNNNYISSIHEDIHHNLWVGTFGGIYKQIAETDSFVYYSGNAANRLNLSNNQIESIISDREGKIWIATQDGLNRYNDQTNNFTTYKTNNLNGGNIFYSIVCTPKGELLVGSYGSGLFTYNKEQDKLISVRDFPSKFIRSVFCNSNGDVWIGTTDEGLWHKPNNANNYHKVELKNRYGKRLTPEISSLSIDLQNRVWIGTSDCGLIVYDLQTNTVAEYTEQMNKPYSLSNNSIDNIGRDKKGNMWISTHGGGVNFYSPFFSVLWFQKSKSENWLAGNIVSCFLEDEEQKIWIGTDGNGFSQFDRENRTFINYSVKDGLPSNAVLDIKQIDKNTLAIALWNGGLSFFNKKNKTFTNYLYNSKFANQKGNNVRSLWLDEAQKQLWCATFNDGVRVFDLAKHEFLPKTPLQDSIVKHEAHSLVYKVLLNKQNRAWWFTPGFAISMGNELKTYSFNAQDTNSINDVSISDICIDSEQNLWIASFAGINKFNPAQNNFTRINMPNTNGIKALLEDGNKRFWLTTGQGLLLYNRQTKQLEDMSAHWGIPHTQFNFRAAYRSHSGYLYFGGIDGFIFFHEDSLYNKAINPPIYVTRLLVHNIEQTTLNKQSPLGRNIINSEKIILQPSQSSISLEYASLNYIDNQKTRYKYILKGFDKQWINAGTERKATYTNLPAGKYSFMVQCTNSNGYFAGSQQSIEITVLPPWWLSWWFKIVLTLLLVAIVIAAIYLREQNSRKRSRRLEKQVQIRTAELAEANYKLGEQKEELLTQYNQVAEQQRVIQIKNEELTENIQTKDRIISVLAHDLKNPLTVLVGFSELLQHNFDSNNREKLRSYANHIAVSSQNIMNQVISLLEWAGSRSKNLQYSPENANLETLMRDAMTLQNEMALNKHIQLVYQSSAKHTAWVDPRMVSTIMRNILANSIKYTHRNGTINVQLFEEANWVCFTISDTGIGIENVDLLFTEEQNSSQLGTEMEKGFGMGMIICKDFIEKNNGTLHITSERNQGSQFTVKLPVGQALVSTVSLASNALISNQTMLADFASEEKDVLLIIEDNAELSSYLKNIFIAQFHIEVANNGAEGLAMAQELMPDLVFCDINLPGMNGREVCHTLKKDSATSHIPVFFITSETSPDQQVQGLLLGADDYITKPFNVEVLKSKVVALRRNRETYRNHLRMQLLSQPKVNDVTTSEERFLMSVTELIEANLSAESFSVDTLAQQMGLSRAQIFRKFKTILGTSPNDFIKTYRLRKAAQMLKTGSFRVSEVAYATGFSDPRYFSTCFTKEFGVSPSKFIEDETGMSV